MHHPWQAQQQHPHRTKSLIADSPRPEEEKKPKVVCSRQKGNQLNGGKKRKKRKYIFFLGALSPSLWERKKEAQTPLHLRWWKLLVVLTLQTTREAAIHQVFNSNRVRTGGGEEAKTSSTKNQTVRNAIDGARNNVLRRALEIEFFFFFCDWFSFVSSFDTEMSWRWGQFDSRVQPTAKKKRATLTEGPAWPTACNVEENVSCFH